MLVMFGVITAVFFLFTILPGDPARMMLDQREDSEQLAAVKTKYGFDKPVLARSISIISMISAPFPFIRIMKTIIPTWTAIGALM